MCSLRGELIETSIVETVIKSATRRDIKRLQEHVSREQDAWRANDRRAILKLSGEFHLLLAEAADNSILLEVLRDLVSRSSLIIAVYQSPGASPCPPDAHRELTATLERRERAAIKLMIQHLDHVFADLMLAGAQRRRYRPEDRVRCPAMIGDPRAYPRDLRGYGRKPPHPRWPNGARIAVQIVLNHEEGGESCVLDGDPASETFLSEIIGATAFPMRHMSMESLFEYGSRAGLWRVLRAFEERRLPITVFAVARALQRHSEAVAAYRELGAEIAAHGLRWISYQQVDESTERAHMAEAVHILKELTGAAPLGWYTGRDSPHTRRLVVEHGGFLYDSDSYADDLPYWTRVADTPHLVVPYALDTNDMRFATAQGFNSGTQFFDYLKDSFDILYREGDPAGLDSPKMLSIGLHARLCGRPGRIAALERFLDYVLAHERVWICRRIDIARHWIATHPAEPGAGGGEPVSP